jgi:hypothetical protein
VYNILALLGRDWNDLGAHAISTDALFTRNLSHLSQLHFLLIIHSCSGPP